MKMEVAVSKKTIDFIFQEETGGREYYEKHGARPSWPKGSSGLTVGAGYDLGYNSLEEIQKDWKGIASDQVIKLMQSVSGLRGQKAANALTSKIINGIYIPYELAYKQYVNRVIKPEITLTVKAFPEAEKLNPDTLGILTSVVYNRGTDLTDNDIKAQDRREMRQIKALVPKKDYKGIAAQIRSMKRLWDGIPDYTGDHEQKFTGLVLRREREAVIVEGSERKYDPSELITFTV
jgi:hypothetical protein